MVTIFLALLAVHMVGCTTAKETTSTPFYWGVAGAAYQIEGATSEDGRSECIWDTFGKIPGKISNGDTADVSADSYHKFKEDVKLIKNMGLNAYRFSISWSRILPKGRGEINQLGVDYYNNLIDDLLKHGIEPFVTMYHWDLPQALEDEYAGWLDGEKSKQDFVR